jgi:hypothetical protein
MKTIAFSLLLGAAALGLAPPAAVQAQTHKDKDHDQDAPRPAKYYVNVKGNMVQMTDALEATLTFDKPVQIPKVVLPAGTYLFKLIAPSTMRVMTEDGTHVFAVFNMMGASRLNERHESVLLPAQLRFQDTGAGRPPMLIGLFPDGSTSGWAPLYSKKQREANAPIATGGVK